MSEASLARTVVPEFTLKPRAGSWFAFVGAPGLDSAPAPAPFSPAIAVAGDGRSRALYLQTKVGCPLPLTARRASCGVVFEGVLHVRRELADLLSADPKSNDAALLLEAYLRWGEEFLRR